MQVIPRRTVVVRRSKLGKVHVFTGDWSWENTTKRRLYQLIRFAEAARAARGKSYEEGIEIRRKLMSGPVPIPKPVEKKTLILTPSELLELRFKAIRQGIEPEELSKYYDIYVITPEREVMPLKEYKKEVLTI
ncbi:MAG: hypothetical protein DRJ63_10330 [Thermoprotei archaeon]|nr:MAG: hypothetical protein B6U94_08610 [Thermofilum sp. ex4484_79]RLE96601.1 MAG: hypothetical protein DRJ63_10330 [Thermoprotei archaeon]